MTLIQIGSKTYTVIYTQKPKNNMQTHTTSKTVAAVINNVC